MRTCPRFSWPNESDFEIEEAEARIKERFESLENDAKRAYWKICDSQAPQIAPFPILMYAFASIDYVTSCWNGFNDKKVSEEKGFVQKGINDNQQLHRDITTLRDRVMAHTDVDFRNPSIGHWKTDSGVVYPG